jgi:hypothetical protein
LAAKLVREFGKHANSETAKRERPEKPLYPFDYGLFAIFSLFVSKLKVFFAAFVAQLE